MTPKLTTPHAMTLTAIPHATRSYYGQLYRVTANATDDGRELLVFRGIRGADLARYAAHHGYAVNVERA